MAIGNVSVSSLISSAESSARKNRAYQDRVAAFEWESSQKNEGDYLDYLGFLNDRAENATTPSEALSYQTTIRSARRSFISEELQRETIKILQGGGSTLQKLNRALELTELAYQNGDLNAAQNIYSQALSLEIKYNNELASEARRAQDRYKAGKADAITFAEGIFNDPEGSFITTINGVSVELPTIANLISQLEKDPSLILKQGAELAQALGAPDGLISNPLDIILYGMLTAQEHLGGTAMYLQDVAPDLAADLVTKANDAIAKNITIGGKTFSGAQDINMHREAINRGHPMFSVVTTGADQIKLVDNKQTGFSQFGGARVTQEVIDDELGEKFSEYGFELLRRSKRDDGVEEVLIQAVDEDGFGISNQVPALGYVQEDGTVQFVDPSTDEGISFNPKTGEFREILDTPGELGDFLGNTLIPQNVREDLVALSAQDLEDQITASNQDINSQRSRQSLGSPQGLSGVGSPFSSVYTIENQIAQTKNRINQQDPTFEERVKTTRSVVNALPRTQVPLAPEIDNNFGIRTSRIDTEATKATIPSAFSTGGIAPLRLPDEEPQDEPRLLDTSRAFGTGTFGGF